jgi:hypothetical protein
MGTDPPAKVTLTSASHWGMRPSKSSAGMSIVAGSVSCTRPVSTGKELGRGALRFAGATDVWLTERPKW